MGSQASLYYKAINVAREPSAAQVTKSYSPGLPGQIFTGKLNFRYQSQPNQLRISPKPRTFIRCSLDHNNQNLSKSVQL